MVIERLRAENYEEFMDFINMVFSQDLIKVHFAEDLPMLFGPDDEHMSHQYALRDDSGRIRSAVASIPYTFMIDGKPFSARTISNVATHYHHTGKGYMQKLLSRALDDMRAEDVDFAILYGHRERYRFFGFEAAGICINASYEAHNAANRKKQGESSDFSFELVQREDTETIKKCLELFNSEPQHYLRPEDKFLDFMGMWRGEAYSVKNAAGEFCGYLNFCKNDVREMYLTSPADTSKVIGEFMKLVNITSTSLTISPFNKEVLKNVYDTAEYITTKQTCRMNLLKPFGFTEACLNSKLGAGAYMPEGELVIESMFGRMLIKNDGGFTVTKTDRPADIVIPGYEIYSLLFGPCPPVMSPYCSQLGKYAAWFPAPFYIHSTDRY